LRRAQVSTVRVAARFVVSTLKLHIVGLYKICADAQVLRNNALLLIKTTYSIP
jgi:hypothetical protein